MKKLLSLLLALSLALSLAACGAADVPRAQGRQVTDLLDRTVPLPDRVERVVVTFNLEEYLAVAGAEGVDRLAGYSHAYWEGRREDAWEAYTAAFPQLRQIPDVGYNDGISVETILGLAPDLVLMSAPVNYSMIEPELDKLAQAGVQVAFVDYHAQTLEAHRRSTCLIGEVLDQQERAEEIADFYEAQMALVTDRLAGLGPDAPRPKVYMEFSRGRRSGAAPGPTRCGAR